MRFSRTVAFPPLATNSTQAAHRNERALRRMYFWRSRDARARCSRVSRSKTASAQISCKIRQPRSKPRRRKCRRMTRAPSSLFAFIRASLALSSSAIWTLASWRKTTASFSSESYCARAQEACVRVGRSNSFGGCTGLGMILGADWSQAAAVLGRGMAAFFGRCSANVPSISLAPDVGPVSSSSCSLKRSSTSCACCRAAAPASSRFRQSAMRSLAACCTCALTSVTFFPASFHFSRSFCSPSCATF